jgi:hypothetical protein
MTTNKRRWISVALLTMETALGLANGSASALVPDDPDHPATPTPTTSSTVDGGASEDGTTSSIEVPVSLPCSPAPEPAPEPAPAPALHIFSAPGNRGAGL